MFPVYDPLPLSLLTLQAAMLEKKGWTGTPNEVMELVGYISRLEHGTVEQDIVITRMELDARLLAAKRGGWSSVWPIGAYTLVIVLLTAFFMEMLA